MMGGVVAMTDSGAASQMNVCVCVCDICFDFSSWLAGLVAGYLFVWCYSLPLLFFFTGKTIAELSLGASGATVVQLLCDPVRTRNPRLLIVIVIHSFANKH